MVSWLIRNLTWVRFFIYTFWVISDHIKSNDYIVMDIRGGDLQSDKAIVQYDRKMTM